MTNKQKRAKRFDERFYYLIPSKEQAEQGRRGSLNADDHIYLKENMEKEITQELKELLEFIEKNSPQHRYCGRLDCSKHDGCLVERAKDVMAHKIWTEIQNKIQGK